MNTQYFPKFCEQKSSVNLSGGIKTQDLCIARADVAVRVKNKIIFVIPGAKINIY